MTSASTKIPERVMAEACVLVAAAMVLNTATMMKVDMKATRKNRKNCAGSRLRPAIKYKTRLNTVDDANLIGIAATSPAAASAAG